MIFEFQEEDMKEVLHCWVCIRYSLIKVPLFELRVTPMHRIVFHRNFNYCRHNSTHSTSSWLDKWSPRLKFFDVDASLCSSTSLTCVYFLDPEFFETGIRTAPFWNPDISKCGSLLNLLSKAGTKVNWKIRNVALRHVNLDETVI